jgi:ectoine hydroxylase-related dioxygenase (phytanoyl-CoA dioxygenase family)
MRTKLTQEQIDTYQRDGCLVYEGLFSDQEVEEILAGISDAVKTMGKNKVAGEGADMKEGNDYYDNVFLQRVNLWKISPVVKRYFLGPEIGEMISKLAGKPTMRVWHDQTLQKMPWANPTGWHLDNPYWSFHSPDAITIWVALDDATVQNGCLYYLPGTQKKATFERNSSIEPNLARLFTMYPEWKTIEPVVGEMKRGSAGFHNGLTGHGAGPNMTPRPRRAMTCAYFPHGATFNGQKNIIRDDQVAKLKVGDVLSDDEQNPVVWPQ